MTNNEQEDQEVGYKMPPRATQFQKGRSGNPKGRPKGAKGLLSLIIEDGRQLVRINGPNGPRMISKRRAAIMQLGNKAAQGDHRAIREYLQQLHLAEQADQAGGIKSLIHERDSSVLQEMLERIRRTEDEPLNDLATASPEEPK